MNRADAARAVRQRARELGFDAVGIAEARRLDRDGEALAAWLAGDRNASMAWMARRPEQRSDPRLVLPGCRSVVVVALNYWAGAAAEPRRTGRVARYARGRDYHKVFKKKLAELCAWLAAECAATSKALVDTGPVLERAWAERAGIGWIGKNANLLTRELGSWILLGEILTTAELEPDPGPHADHCGTCTACIEACPTSAITAPGVVDSKRCISYWTIEHRGAIPAERRAGLGEWIFGCDDCQTSCPWNERFARPAEGDPFERRADLQALDPLAILSLDEAEFRRRYSGTALMRAKWEGLRRNACVVAGNQRDGAAVPGLRRALADADAVVRAHAAWALGRIGGAAAAQALAEALVVETDATVRAEISAAREEGARAS
jgi:epoxyqueuosine reductase